MLGDAYFIVLKVAFTTQLRVGEWTGKGLFSNAKNKYYDQWKRIIDGGVAHMVERSLRMREARGSIPRTSTFFLLSVDEVFNFLLRRFTVFASPQQSKLLSTIDFIVFIVLQVPCVGAKASART
ncbi:hypothetical protein Ancab_015470 [Ancistrocladus abbreviatus]